MEANDLAMKWCGHDPRRIKIMMAEIGALKTAKKLMVSYPSTFGYLKMAECDCLDITSAIGANPKKPNNNGITLLMTAASEAHLLSGAN